MRKRSGIISITLGIIASIALLLAYYGYSPAVSRPALNGEFRSDTIEIGDIQRSYSFYLPNNLPDQPALVFMLHGSLQSIDDIRGYTAYQFEQLADQHKFILVYPAGYKNNWNDCRKTANYPARTENIDDIKFIKTLMSHFEHRFGSNSTKSFMAGFSNGGHLGFRFALENPNDIGGIAAISANLPSASNLDCFDKGVAVPVLVMNGTDDPINPYHGGRVTLFGFGDRGDVLSSIASAEHFARTAGYHGAPSETKYFLNSQHDDPTATKYIAWRDNQHAEIMLYTVTGGGHTIPQPYFRFPRILGATGKEINGPAEIWAFFHRQMN
ncbi:PHB depolymerase family esterase [Zhongshania sp.]|uniref:alpha/beta hydrolase family esterase n=1 Tax=Zhongshania sp. TaxID=1971902 RepID=UPI001B7AF613|nr:PHB depolymerase family esterase [Zhongshania sp.]MBQ0796138.1 hypothetical protein [Zhongshania sp.]